MVGRLVTLLFYQDSLPTYVISGVSEQGGRTYHIKTPRNLDGVTLVSVSLTPLTRQI